MALGHGGYPSLTGNIPTQVRTAGSPGSGHYYVSAGGAGYTLERTLGGADLSDNGSPAVVSVKEHQAALDKIRDLEKIVTGLNEDFIALLNDVSQIKQVLRAAQSGRPMARKTSDPEVYWEDA